MGELAQILHSGIIKGGASYLDHELRQRVSIVSVDVSPDLRQARISVSVRRAASSNNSNDDKKDNKESIKYYETDPAVDKRRAHSWLVDNTKAIRHTLAQKVSHMKTSPSLSFVQVDVAAATDVMYLIDKVSKGYRRDNIEELDYFCEGNDDFDNDDDWEEFDNDFFD